MGLVKIGFTKNKWNNMVFLCDVVLHKQKIFRYIFLAVQHKIIGSTHVVLFMVLRFDFDLI